MNISSNKIIRLMAYSGPRPSLMRVSGGLRSAHMGAMISATDSPSPPRTTDAGPLEAETNPAPQHLGTCNRCHHTYLLGTKCGTSDHRQ
ncbi:hypothetical protein ABIB45_000788 [Arthrobacter sp. UYCo732]